MSGMVLTQLLNPESGIDRPRADQAQDGVGRSRPEGPSRYDEVVRQQEKRLEQRRAQERAARNDEQRQLAQRNDSATSTSRHERSTEQSAEAAKERRPEAEGASSRQAKKTDTADKTSEVAGKQAQGNTESGDDSETDPASLALSTPLDGVQDTALMGLAMPATDQRLPSQGLGGQSGAQLMASLTGTGETATGLKTPGALFAAMLEAGQEKGSQGRELLAGLQGSALQGFSDGVDKTADSLTTQLATRLTGPEMSQPLSQSPSLRGAEAQALVRNYSTSVDVPVGESEWGEKVMGKLAFLTASQMSVAEIHVTPADLGPLEVRVQVQNDQATVTVHAATPAVREQLELHGHRLRDMLSEQGLSLEGFDVSDSGGRETADQQGSGDSSGEGGSGHGPAGSEEVTGADTAEVAELDLSWKGELDLYA